MKKIKGYKTKKLYSKYLFDLLFYVCANCGKVHSQRIRSFNSIDGVICEYCRVTEYTRCVGCGDVIHNNTSNVLGSYRLCNNCIDDYTICNECGTIVSNRDIYTTDDYDYCQECWENRCSSIKDYNYKPSPNFHTMKFEPRFFMGVELEVDNGGEDTYHADNILNDLRHCYCKHDGSLEDGFEIVTHPCTLEYHTHIKPVYEKAFEYLIRKGYKSHNCDSCGLHIHINKDFLGITTTEIENNTSKILYVFEKYWEKFVIFSRRNEKELNQWAKRYNLKLDDTFEQKSKEIKYHSNRYFAINLQNDATIEFRMFKGTLKIDTFMATLQLINVLVNNCKKYSIMELQKKRFSTLVKSDFVELNNYLIEKNLIKGGK